MVTCALLISFATGPEPEQNISLLDIRIKNLIDNKSVGPRHFFKVSIKENTFQKTVKMSKDMSLNGLLCQSKCSQLNMIYKTTSEATFKRLDTAFSITLLKICIHIFRSTNLCGSTAQ